MSDELELEQELQIFQIEAGETDWVIAHTASEAVKCLEDHMDFEGDFSLKVVPKEEWKNHTIKNVEEDGYTINEENIETFEARMAEAVAKKEATPIHICGTMFL